MEEKRQYIKNLLPYLLLLFEIVQLSSSVSPDELNIPYVPYVVVEKNKNEFDFDRVQETIVKYLENRSQRQTYEEPEQSTTLYDYFRTSTTIPKIQKPIDTRSMDLHPLNFHSLNHFQTDAPTTYRGRLPYRYETTPMYNLTSISKSYDTYATKFYPPVTDMAMQETKFVPLKDPAFGGFPEGPLLGHQIPKRGMDGPPFSLGNGGSMKCSLRSSRYVYDGDCKSKKPIVETVCADRCIKYEYNKMNKPFFSGSPHTAKFPKSIEIQRPVVALACKDGDVKKQKIKLYCKDGTIINNIIRIVNSCICQEHSEKVHKKKHNQPKENLRARTYNRRALPKVPNTYLRPYK